MAKKDDGVYIDHMLDCIRHIDEFIENKEHFYRERLIQDAVARNLQVMAESSQRLSEKAKQQHPKIPWRNIAGFRNILVHDYLGLDVDAIWSVVEMELPKLEEALEKMQAKK